MGRTGAWLIDTSAIVRLADSPDASLWAERLQRGLVRVSTVTLLESGFSARSAREWVLIHAEPPLVSMPMANLTPTVESRAVEVQGELARRGYHRAVSIPDLLVAAVAELAGYTVLHVDKDFDLIAEVTGQRVERLREA
ncbi:hypothetical protein EDD28_2056 [Salana multivorans]|uniref:Ribonuclease VapC n=1 Tax=Salana multivorans TaxID=120377 RepID=A0A3N2DCI8_9MICO|nr:PIN domain nuclease [Salana multivorans]ROR97457.1 hypothetical protein EDD28_2056 [Salana multivorans]